MGECAGCIPEIARQAALPETGLQQCIQVSSLLINVGTTLRINFCSRNPEGVRSLGGEFLIMRMLDPRIAIPYEHP